MVGFARVVVVDGFVVVGVGKSGWARSIDCWSWGTTLVRSDIDVGTGNGKI